MTYWVGRMSSTSISSSVRLMSQSDNPSKYFLLDNHMLLPSKTNSLPLKNDGLEDQQLLTLLGRQTLNPFLLKWSLFRVDIGQLFGDGHFRWPDVTQQCGREPLRPPGGRKNQMVGYGRGIILGCSPHPGCKMILCPTNIRWNKNQYGEWKLGDPSGRHFRALGSVWSSNP